MNSTRPKNLNLFTIRFPLTAIASILHRVSGFFLFLCIPVMLWALQASLTDRGFSYLQCVMHAELWAKVIVWMLLVPFCYHLVAGMRHLLSDLHVGNTRAGGKIAVIVVFASVACLILLAGIWIW